MHVAAADGGDEGGGGEGAKEGRGKGGAGQQESGVSEQQLREVLKKNGIYTFPSDPELRQHLRQVYSAEQTKDAPPLPESGEGREIGGGGAVQSIMVSGGNFGVGWEDAMVGEEGGQAEDGGADSGEQSVGSSGNGTEILTEGLPPVQEDVEHEDSGRMGQNDTPACEVDDGEDEDREAKTGVADNVDEYDSDFDEDEQEPEANLSAGLPPLGVKEAWAGGGDMREGAAAAAAARGKGAQVVPPLVLSEMEELVSEGADLLERLPSRDAADVARLVAGDVSGSRSPVALALQAHLVSRPLCGLLAVIGSRRLGVVGCEVLGWDRAGFWLALVLLMDLCAITSARALSP